MDDSISTSNSYKKTATSANENWYQVAGHMEGTWTCPFNSVCNHVSYTTRLNFPCGNDYDESIAFGMFEISRHEI